MEHGYNMNRPRSIQHDTATLPTKSLLSSYARLTPGAKADTSLTPPAVLCLSTI